MQVRHPSPDEADRVVALFDDEVKAGRMLPRDPASVHDNTHDWLVIATQGAVVGCVSLVHFNTSLCEIRSLAVDADYRGQGLASRLILAALELARRRGARDVLSLTRAVTLFTKLGFKHDTVNNFPEKVWRDCAPCPFRHACDEVALIFHLHPK